MPFAAPVVIAAAAVASVGVSTYSAIAQGQAAKKQGDAARAANEAQMRQIEAERKQEALRQQAMELDARRKQKEFVRNLQRTRALSLATATAQGAASGSGLQGAYGQSSGQYGVNALGVNQALELGRENSALNGQISDARIAGANANLMFTQARTDAATAAGYASLGGALVSAAGTFSGINWGSAFGSPGSQQMNTYPGFLRGIGSNGIY